LSRCRSVSLPGPGTLASERRSATLINKNLMRPPSYKLSWSEGLPADIDALQLIETGLAIGKERAEEEYEKWAGGLTAKEIMQLFDTELNLNSRYPIRVRPERRINPWPILLIVIFLLLGTLLYMYGDSLFYQRAVEPWNVEIADNVSAWQEADAPPAEEEGREIGVVALNIYHIVIGVFSTDENADRFIASKPQLTLTKLDYGSGRVLVCLYAAATIEEAIRLQERAQNETEPAAWMWNSETKSAVNR